MAKFILIGLFGFLFIALGRIYVGSSDAFNHAQQLEREGSVERAVLFYGRALRWYFPGNPGCKEAIAGLENIAKKAEQRGEIMLALNSLRVLSGSLRSLKSLTQPYLQTLSKTDAEIARITPLAYPNLKLSEETVLEQLSTFSSPPLFWVLINSLGFLGWISAVFGFIRYGFTEDGQYRAKLPSVAWGLGILCCFSIWIFTLSKV